MASQTYRDKGLYVAPMMAWTDRHCRMLHRQFTQRATLFTEMVTTGALLQGGQWHQLDHNAKEHPLVLQLGGSDPAALAQCAERAKEYGYCEVNLNIGCPSERVQRGTFGACLMREPALVAQCVTAMSQAVDLPITVKCRLGVDEHDTDELLEAFISQVSAAGCEKFYIHARKAILGGLSPAQNRSIPPLQPERVRRVKERHPHLNIVLNGGITTVEHALEHLQWADGVMLGRAAYQQPAILSAMENALEPTLPAEPRRSIYAILLAYRHYMSEELNTGTRLHSLTRHVLTVCNGYPGARQFRRILSDQQRLKKNDLSVFDEALACVFAEAA
jgi:tRNA-dihydrouridine synthase A